MTGLLTSRHSLTLSKCITGRSSPLPPSKAPDQNYFQPQRKRRRKRRGGGGIKNNYSRLFSVVWEENNMQTHSVIRLKIASVLACHSLLLGRSGGGGGCGARVRWGEVAGGGAWGGRVGQEVETSESWGGGDRTSFLKHIKTGGALLYYWFTIRSRSERTGRWQNFFQTNRKKDVVV